MPDDFQYVKLPDGSYGKFASDADDSTIQAAISKDFPGAYKPSLDLTNQKGEGVYPMWNDSGHKVPVPYSQVDAAQGQGYKFDINPLKTGLTPSQQFTKDQAADPNRRSGTSFRMDSGLTPEQSQVRSNDIEAGMSAPMQAVAGIAKGGGMLASPVLDVANKIAGGRGNVGEMLKARGPIQEATRDATLGAAILPAAAAAPATTAAGLVGGTLGAGAGQAIGAMANMRPENTALLSDALGLAGGLASGIGGAKLEANAGQYLRPTPSPKIVPPTETAAMDLAAKILPAGKDSSNFVRAAQSEVPNVIAYAKQTDNPLNTQIEFAKAAEGYAKQALDLKASILDPVANKIVKTSGTGFGERMHEGPDTYATIGEIDKRIIEINKQLDKPTLNADDQRRALASKVDLQREVSGLRYILNNELAKSSGYSPAEIADIRQRAGAAYELANDTSAAVLARMQASGRTDLGPIKLTELPSRALEFARGGPVPIADRNFQRAIRNFPGEARPFPTANANFAQTQAANQAAAQAAYLREIESMARAREIQANARQLRSGAQR